LAQAEQMRDDFLQGIRFQIEQDEQQPVGHGRDDGGRPPWQGRDPAVLFQATVKSASSASNSDGRRLVMARRVLGLDFSSS
jgi:hypothetical protein